MSDSWQHARGLAKQLQRELPEQAEIDGELRAGLERAVAGALQTRARAKRTRRFGLGAGVATSLGVAAALLFVLRAPGLRVGEGAALAKQELRPALLEGDLTVEPSDGDVMALAPGALGPTSPGAVLRSGEATTVRVAATASLEMRDAVLRVDSFGKTAAFFLDAGEVRVDGRAEEVHFTVRTPDATVRGSNARFDVERTGSACGRTRIVVHRGLVDVRTERGSETIAPGAAWSDCGRATPPRAAGSTAVKRTLDDQNDALAMAVSARRAGRTDDSLQAYARFLVHWPNGPLSEVARADRMNLLATRDPNAAARAARDYLRLHPDGSAAERARKLSKKGSE